MFNVRFSALLAFVAVAVVSRLLPHPPNFAPMGAICLFAGAHFSGRWAKFAVPLSAMVLSSFLLGLMHGGSYKFFPFMPYVHGSFALIVCVGMLLQRRQTVLSVTCASLASSVLFFLITNFGIWAGSTRYSAGPEGLLASYVAAIPFFHNTLLSDLLYSAVLFGGFALAQQRFPQLRANRGLVTT